MKTRACLAIFLLWFLAPVFGDTFYKTARAAQELESKGVPIPQEAMEMTAGLIQSFTVDLTDASGKRLGSGLLGTFYHLWNTQKKEPGTVTYVLLPAAVLGQATRVTVSCRITGYHVDPLTVELPAEGKARHVSRSRGEAEGLVAILLPDSFRETGCGLNDLSRPGEKLRLGSGMTVWFPCPEGEPEIKGATRVKGVEKTTLLHAASDGKDTWAVSAGYRGPVAGAPVFTVEEKLLYGMVGGQNWLYAYHTELAGIIERAVTLNPPSPAKAKPGPAKPEASTPEPFKDQWDRLAGRLAHPEEALETKYYHDASGVISRASIVAAATELRRKVLAAGWVFSEEPAPKAGAKSNGTPKN
jgi:hypothetical protein